MAPRKFSPFSVAAEHLAATVYPRRCAACGSGEWPFCEACSSKVVPLLKPWCLTCGKPWPVSVSRCPDCPPEVVSGVRAPFLFKGPVREAVLRLKFGGWRAVADIFADAMVACDVAPPVDAITWVPLSRRRLAQRGFDQARLLAEGCARRLELPSLALTKRVIASSAQAKRSATDRWAAMSGAFRPRQRHSPASVLLVDDVFTTGATTTACAEALWEAGARHIYVLTAARSLPGWRGRSYTRSGSRPGLWLPGDVLR